jgi:stringent starvation protein B
MISTKPYFVRAIFEWLIDQGLTPYITVAVNASTRVPREFVKDGHIVLNIGPDAANELLLTNDAITFKARFNGAVFPVAVPMDRVAAIFAKENHEQGLVFELAATNEPEPADQASAEPVAPPDDPPQEPPTSSGRPHLTRIK